MAAPAFEPRRFGAYALEARLGHGGMAEVFRASREGIAGFARQCVVSRILGHHNEDPSFVDMFINEAKIASQLTHPNIVQVYDLGQVDGEFFIAMEYVKGKDLLRVLRELAQKRAADPVIPPSIAAYIARETCRALQHAHDHSDERGVPRPIIHRDVSPQNIMVSYDGIIKLVDFGIAKALGSMREETRTGALKGKFAYMAPEQIAGQNPGPSADVFATGVVLHEMLTGRRLFKGPTDYDTLTKVRSMVVPVPSSIDARIQPELDAIVMKSLERDRAQRYEKASQMARDLDSYLQTMRFSVEEMSEFMRALFPIDPREPNSSEHVTTEYVMSVHASASESNVETTPLSTGSNPTVPPTDEHMHLAPTPTHVIGGRRTMLIAGGLALLVGLGLMWIASRKPVAEEPIIEPTVVAQGEKIPDVTALPQETRTVLVRSEPSGARVFEGPKLIGETPFEMKLPVESPGETVTLVRAGRADLTYLVRPSDAPELTLRLVPVALDVAPPGVEVRPLGVPRPTLRGGKKLKLDSSDDQPVPTTRPKVETFED